MRKILISSVTLLAVLLCLLCPAFAAGEDGFALSQKGLDFIKHYEGFRSTAYQANGKWYIGYGTSCQETDYPDGITEAEGEALLLASAKSSVSSVNQFISKYNLDLEQHQFDALVSFSYGLGTGWMSTTYRLSDYLIRGIEGYDDAEIVDAMGVWCHVGSKVDEGCLQRRIDEGRLLLYGDYGDEDSTQFHYLILDAAGGTIVNDTVCYESGKPYGTLPAATRAQYTLDGWYAQDGMKLTADMMVSKNRTVTAKWTPDASLSFSDMKATDWFYPYVFDLYHSGVINGHSPERFAPQESLTRGQALKLILLAAGHKAQAPTGSHWASGYLAYAVSQGFLSSDKLSLDEDISRLEIAQIAVKALKFSAVTMNSPFSDTADQAVLTLYDKGIFEGSLENGVVVFKPNSDITRAEISAVIWRMEQFAEKPSTPSIPITPSIPSTPSTPAPKPEDHSKQFLYNGTWFDILPNVPLNPYDSNLFYKNSDGRILYRSNEYRCETGIDVSVYQGDIDWKRVKAAGIDFAIIRVGGRGYGVEGKIYGDTKFKQNIEGALAAGMDVGIYFFSQAITVEEAVAEANYTINQIKGYDITYPVVFDWEQIGGTGARTYGLDTKILCAAANAFCEKVENAGYKPMVYFNAQCAYVKYNLSEVVDYEFWFAQYPSSNLYPNFYYHYDIWQYTDSGTVDGIAGKVDMNLYLIKK